MGNYKAQSRNNKGVKPSSTTGYALDATPDDSSRPVSRSSATTVRDIMASRKSRDSKDDITKDAVKKSDTRAEAPIAQAIRNTRSTGKAQSPEPKVPDNGRHVGRQLVRWSRTY
jgi:hypothetical protein